MIFSLMGLAFSSADAQQSDSLSAYLKEAAANNPGLKAKFSQYLAAVEKVPQAGSLPDPELQFGIFIKPMEILDGKQVADFRLMQMLPWFGSLKTAKDEASNMALAKYEEMQSVKNELFLQVKMSWYEIFLIKTKINLTQKSHDILQSLERLALIKIRAGDVSASGTGATSPVMQSAPKSDNKSMGDNNKMGRNDAGSSDNSSGMPLNTSPGMSNSNAGGMVNLLRVKIELGSLENRQALLGDQLITAIARFNSYLNRKPDEQVSVVDSLSEIAFPGSLVSLTDSLSNNPMIRMLEADRSANEARIAMANKMGYPMLGLGINYSLIGKRQDANSMMNGRDMIMPMVTATLPVYRKKYTALRREAEFLRDAAGESVENARNELTVSYQETLQSYNDAVRRENLFRNQAFLAEKSISLLTTSFSSSGTDFGEILRMQQQLLDYQFNQIEALVDQHKAVDTLFSIISFN